MLSFIMLLFMLSSLSRACLFPRRWGFFGGWHPWMYGPRMRGPFMGGPFWMHGPFTGRPPMGGPFGMHGHPRGPWMGGRF